MKIYDLYDTSLPRSLGTLLYFEGEKAVIIELEEDLDEWSAPLLFAGFVKQGIYTIPRSAGHLWLQERVIPCGRQNINSILRNHRLKEYDEMKFLELSGGKNSQDSIAVQKRDSLPEYVAQRMQKNLTGIFAAEGRNLICFFADDTLRKIDLAELSEDKDVDKILRNDGLFESVTLGAGGYYADFGNSIDLPAGLLYHAGTDQPLKKSDFVAFAEKNVVDTTEAGILLECSRQNIAYMIRRKQLEPIKRDTNGNLFLKEDVVKNRW